MGKYGHNTDGIFRMADVEGVGRAVADTRGFER